MKIYYRIVWQLSNGTCRNGKKIYSTIKEAYEAANQKGNGNWERIDEVTRSGRLIKKPVMG